MRNLSISTLNLILSHNQLGDDVDLSHLKIKNLSKPADMREDTWVAFKQWTDFLGKKKNRKKIDNPDNIFGGNGNGKLSIGEVVAFANASNRTVETSNDGKKYVSGGQKNTLDFKDVLVLKGEFDPNSNFAQPDMIPITDVYMELKEDYDYTWEGDDGYRYKITVPKGMVTEGASVPRLLWTISGITPDGLHRGASLVHDFIYIKKGRFKSGELQRQPIGSDANAPWEDAPENTMTRKKADKLFLRMMQDAGFNKSKRAYRAVRFAGGLWWKRNQSAPQRAEADEEPRAVPPPPNNQP